MPDGEHPEVAEDIAEAEARGHGLFVLHTFIHDNGRVMIAFDEVEPAHLGYLFAPNIADAVEQALLATAMAKAQAQPDDG